MAGDWIKMATGLRTHPKVVRIASALKADRYRVIGGLHAVWSLFDAHSDDGMLVGYSPEILDEEIGWTGFTAALIAIDWASFDGESIVLPRFEAHNGQSAKRRAMEADRKRTVRKASASPSASDADKKRTREEKNREEKEASPIAPSVEGASKGPAKNPRKVALTFPQFLEACRFSGEKPLTTDDPITKFTDAAGIPREFLGLAWKEFGRKHMDDGKKQADWRATFRNAIRGNWLKLWYEKDGDWVLTSVGIALQRERAAQRQEAA